MNINRQPRRLLALAAIPLIALATVACDVEDQSDEDETEQAAADQTGAEEPATTETPTTTEPETPGDDPYLNGLYDDCDGGDMGACDDLYMESPFGSDYEAFGDSCGDRNEPAGFCVDIYGDEPDLEGAFTLEDVTDITIDGMGGSFTEFCDALATTEAFDPELAYESFADGYADAAEPLGYTTREVYDELRSRC